MGAGAGQPRVLRESRADSHGSPTLCAMAALCHQRYARTGRLSDQLLMANEDKSTRYHRLRRRASLGASGSVAVLLMGLMITGGSGWLGAASRQFTGGSLLLTTALYVTSIVLLVDLVQLPFAYYQGMTLEHRYG